MRARHETLARDIQLMHAHRFMAAYRYRKVHRLLFARGWKGIGRDRVLRVMRELGIRGRAPGPDPGDHAARHEHGRQAGSGGTPVRRPGSGPSHGGGHHVRAARVEIVRLTKAFVTDAYARRIVGRAVSAGRRTHAPSWSRWTGPPGMAAPQCISALYGIHLKEAGIIASTGTVGDSYDNALAETINSAYRTELIKRSKPFGSVQALEKATFEWVSRWNQERLHGHLGYRTPAEVETLYHRHQATPVAQSNSVNKNQSVPS
jgi:transposase InsO family protein